MNKIVYLFLLLSTSLFSGEVGLGFARNGAYRKQKAPVEELQGERRTYPFMSVGGGYKGLPTVGAGVSMRREAFVVDIEYKTALFLSSLSCSVSAIQYLNTKNADLYYSVGVGGAGFTYLFCKDDAVFAGVAVPLRVGMTISHHFLCDLGVEFMYGFTSEKYWKGWRPFPEMRFGFRF